MLKQVGAFVSLISLTTAEACFDRKEPQNEFFSATKKATKNEVIKSSSDLAKIEPVFAADSIVRKIDWCYGPD